MRIRAVLIISLALSACGGRSSPAKPTSLTVDAASAVLTSAGATTQCKATLHFDNGSTQDQTGQAAWSSSNDAVVRVNAAGVATAVGNGSAAVRAEYQGLSGTSAISVDIDPWTFMGAIWTGSPKVGTEQIAVDPTDDSRWYVSAQESSSDKDGGLFVTRNAGATWTHPISGFAGPIAIDPTNPRIVYYASSQTLYRSDDGGLAWISVVTFQDSVASVLISAVDPRTLFVGSRNNATDSGIYRSVDAGATWTRFSLGARQQNLILWDMAEDVSNGYLYTGAEIADHPQPYRPPFFRSRDRGEHWEDVTGPLPWHVIRIAVHPNSHDVYALTEGAGLFKSADHGAAWTFVSNNFSSALIIDPRNANRFFGGELNYSSRTGGALVSTDSGAHFAAFGLRGRSVSGFCFNGSGTRLYAACYGSGIFSVNLSALGPVDGRAQPPNIE